MRLPTLLFLLLAAMLVVVPTTALAQADPTAEPAAFPTPVPVAETVGPGAVVRGVFFFSPTCPHCEEVIALDLPGMFLATGGEASLTYDEALAQEDVAFYLMNNGTLQLLMVDTSVEAGAQMFMADSERLGLDRAGVPRLDVASDHLVGSFDIPQQFPGIIETGLDAGGIDWPPIPGIEAAVEPFADTGLVPGPDEGNEAAALPATTDGSMLDKLARDPVGNGISIVVLIMLLISLVAVPVLAIRGSLSSLPAWPVPLLVVVGIGVAAYLATIETSGSEAVCGPVGDCNAVQESEYASLFGIPIGVLGVLGYLLIGGLWGVSRVAKGKAADWALVSIAVVAFGGTLFSLYLTFLEPFVIGATCMWCITSAIVMLLLLWLSAGSGWAALQRIRGSGTASGQRGGHDHPATPKSVRRPA
jgi:uncharacterized membrane protein